MSTINKSINRALCLSEAAFLSIAYAASSTAFAQPSAWPLGPWDLKDVKNGTTSTIMSDTNDPNTVWVLPPSAGTASPGKPTGISANVGFCDEMAALQGYSKAIANRIGELTEEQGKAISLMQKKQQAYEDANKAAAALAASSQVLTQISKLSSQVEDYDSRVQKLYEHLDKCGTDANLCNSLTQQLTSVEKQRDDAQKQLTQMQREHNADSRQYMRAKAIADAAKSEFDNSLSSYSRLAAKLIEAQNSLQNVYKHLGQMYGSQSAILYNSGWDENISSLRVSNDRRFKFVKPFTNHTRIHVSFAPGVDSDSYLAQMPIVLSYTLNGVPHKAYEDPNQTEGSAVPSVMQAILNLNLTGTCPILKPAIYGLEKDQNGAPLLGLSATYDYPAAFRAKVKFSYNLSKFYEMIHDTGSKGGFFSSSSWDTIRETKMTRDAFSADWQESDPDNVVPEVEKRKIEKEVQDELVTRVLRDLGMPVYGGSSVQAGFPPPSGSLVLANGLESTCGALSGYCTAGAWMLKGINSLFGSSNQRSSYTQDYQGTATEVWSRETVRYKPGIMVFTNK